MITVLKITAFLVCTPFIALGTLWPINDQPTSPLQAVFFFMLEILLFVFLFGVL